LQRCAIAYGFQPRKTAAAAAAAAAAAGIRDALVIGLSAAGRPFYADDNNSRATCSIAA